MHRIRANQNWTFLCVVVFLALVGCSPQAEQPNAPAETKLAPGKAPGEIWVSETTGKEYRVRVENDVVRAEWVNVTSELASHGAFIRSECKRQGSKWVGEASSYVPCTLETGPKPKIDNWCHLQTKFEIDSITPDSITGRTEAVGSTTLDCMKCKLLRSEMKDFLWTPKE